MNIFFYRLRENCTNDCSGSADNIDINSIYHSTNLNLSNHPNLRISYSNKSDTCHINYSKKF
jgi:hypothetical protein